MTTSLSTFSLHVVKDIIYDVTHISPSRSYLVIFYLFRETSFKGIYFVFIFLFANKKSFIPFSRTKYFLKCAIFALSR
jgi:hypothetical protein